MLGRFKEVIDWYWQVLVQVYIGIILYWHKQVLVQVYIGTSKLSTEQQYHSAVSFTEPLHKAVIFFKKMPDLYKFFGIDKTATTQEIKIKFRELALKYHPDKQQSSTTSSKDDTSDDDFVKLYQYYKVLIDPKSREKYDLYGSISESEIPTLDSFHKITTQDINEYLKLYKYSDSERLDLFNSFTKVKGDLIKILEMVPLCTLQDLSRFKSMIEQGIARGELQDFKQFHKDIDKKVDGIRKRMEKEAKQVEEMNQGLELQLKNSNNSFGNFLSKLDNGGDEEEFERLEQELFQGKGKKAKVSLGKKEPAKKKQEGDDSLGKKETAKKKDASPSKAKKVTKRRIGTVALGAKRAKTQ